MPPKPGNAYVTASFKSFADKLAARPDLYGQVEVTALAPGNFAIAPPGSADLVVTFRNIHNWMSLAMAPDAFAEMFRALKPGGILGVVEHRGDPAKPQDPRAASGYVNEQLRHRDDRSGGIRAGGAFPRSTPTRRTRRTTSRACGRCRLTTGWVTGIARSIRRSARATGLR